jgi:hypothetical protein
MPYTEDEQHRMDRAEDAYLNMRLGERGPVHNPPKWQPWAIGDDKDNRPEDFYDWQPWAMATNELYAQAWLDSHDETGWDHDDQD